MAHKELVGVEVGTKGAGVGARGAAGVAARRQLACHLVLAGMDRDIVLDHLLEELEEDDRMSPLYLMMHLLPSVEMLEWFVMH